MQAMRKAMTAVTMNMYHAVGARPSPNFQIPHMLVQIGMALSTARGHIPKQLWQVLGFIGDP
jgi:hypothetical protein